VSAFVEYLPEVFERFGRVVVKRMFGGHGVYRDGLMFALVHDDALYLKTDAQTCGQFDERGLAPFEFSRQGRLMTTSYRLAPAEMLEDRDLAAEWARRSFEVALRAQAAKPAKKKRNAKKSAAR
jgi:DNA transformation protein